MKKKLMAFLMAGLMCMSTVPAGAADFEDRSSAKEEVIFDGTYGQQLLQAQSVLKTYRSMPVLAAQHHSLQKV